MSAQTARVLAAIGSALFLVVAPGVVAGFVPWWLSGWEVRAPFFDFPPLRGLGVLFVASGILIVLDSFARFVIQGLGTPAPIFPTRHLVVSGLYRFVRNPIYLAVVSIIFGQALLFGSARLLEYGVLVWLAFHVFVLGYEEPTLRTTFGAEYDDFCAHVPRWIPRLGPRPRGRTSRTG